MSIKQGDWVKIVNSPRPESQHFVGNVGRVGRVDANGIFEVEGVYCDEGMVLLEDEPPH